MSTQEQLDDIAWRTLDERIPFGPRPKGSRGGKVHNYVDLWEVTQAINFPHAWSEFLHGFFNWKDVDAFAAPPHPGLGREWGAVLAGSAEYLCHRYKLPVPSWTEEPRYFLSGRFEFVPLVDVWVPWPWFEESGEDEWEQVPDEFRRRGLCFAARNLITL